MQNSRVGLALITLSVVSVLAREPSPPVASPRPAPELRLAAAPRPAARTPGTRPGAAIPPPLSQLSLEVTALEMLDRLDLTARQLAGLEQLAQGAADREDRRTGTGPDELRMALLALREALLRGQDEQADRLQERVAELLEGAGVEVDDGIALTELARQRAPQALKSLTASQVASYLSEYADEIEDPLEELLEAVQEVRETDQADFDVLRDQVADDVALALGGLDLERDKQISDAVTAWLNQVRALPAAEFQQKQADLEQAAKTLVGEVDPLEVIRHYLERDLAELLSNPHLPAVIQARREANPPEVRPEP